MHACVRVRVHLCLHASAHAIAHACLHAHVLLASHLCVAVCDADCVRMHHSHRACSSAGIASTLACIALATSATRVACFMQREMRCIEAGNSTLTAAGLEHERLLTSRSTQATSEQAPTPCLMRCCLHLMQCARRDSMQQQCSSVAPLEQTRPS